MHTFRRIPRSAGTLVFAILAVTTLTMGLTGTAWAAWPASGPGHGSAKAKSMPTGATPTTSLAGSNVTVSWAASSFSGGGAVNGYVVKRYNSSDQEQVVLAGCTGTVSTLSCTEVGVPAGTWRYTVSPKHFNWTGTESAKSASVTVAAASSPLRIASGSYVGNGTDNRRIDTPGFQPDVVVVKAATAQIAVMRTSTMTGDSAKPLAGATALLTNAIQTLESDGFTVGTHATVNTNNVTYQWTAYRAASGTVAVGAYTGTGAARSISGLGFSPEHVSVLGSAAQRATQRFAGMSRGFQFDSDSGTTTRVTALDADGFSLGTSAEVNANGTTYHYVALNDTPASIDIASYSGNAADNRSVTGVGFEPDHVMIRANDTTTGRLGAFRPSAMTGDSSLRFSAAAALANNIQALQADGFELGTDTAVNAGGVAYHYVAMKNTAAGCALPGPRTTSATADAWANQSSPTTTTGADTVLKVTAKATNLNTRAFVGFALPTLPAGCTVTSATLQLYNRSPATGRSLEVARAGAAWTETSLNWNNQPATGGTPATATTPAAAAWMQWNVLNDITAMYAGTNNGFRIKDATESGTGSEQQLDSREGVNKPALVLTFG